MNRALLLAAAAVTLCVPARATAQSAEARLQANRQQLERIRRERTELEARMRQLQSSAHSLSDEVQNLARQQDATQRVVRSLGQQLEYIQDAVKEATANLAHAEDEARTKRAILRARLIDIYKRGPLFDVAVLLSADSFGELVARYKYLHELALHDRALVRRMDDLSRTIAQRRRELVSLQVEIAQNRAEKAREEERLASLRTRKRQRLTVVQRDAQRTRSRLLALQRSEARLNNIIASIEAARRAARVRAGRVARTPSTIRTSDYGRLDWPVDGTILYRFGRVVNPNNTLTRWNGIGIEARGGTPVRAVAAGTVALAAPLGTYGQTVIVEHGGGDYSVYGSLGTVRVRKGERVAKGTIVGTVGTSDPDLPPHLHFEIRHGGPAVDPAAWLRAH